MYFLQEKVVDFYNETSGLERNSQRKKKRGGEVAIDNFSVSFGVFFCFVTFLLLRSYFYIFSAF